MTKPILFVRNVAAAAASFLFAASAGLSADTVQPDPVQLADAVQSLKGADVAVLGETHDNAAHHLNQAALLAALAPRAVVWEMITPDKAGLLTADILSDADRTAQALDWENSGWPDFDLYAPVFAAASGLRNYGAQVPRSAAGEVMQNGAAAYFGTESARFGLDHPLPDDEQTAREADQLSNHCDALPVEMLPMMVEFQRLRDTALAAAAAQALADTGGPVAVITGNGHARTDRGLAVYLARALPDATVRSLGQAEDGQISGSFDVIVDAPAAERPDPCLAFQKDG